MDWIPAEEDLPEFMTDVILLTTVGVCSGARVEHDEKWYWQTNLGQFMDAKLLPHEVVAWLRMPKW